MTELKRYRNLVSDSARWAGFRYRDDDIVICTPPKSGTTWMQTLCAMLVLDTIEFDRPLTQISPYLDMQTAAVEDTLAALEAQRHRRIIKTHTPLDGIPLEPRATYVCVARDPRDVAISMDNHVANSDDEAFLKARSAAVGSDGVTEFDQPALSSADPAERFWAWAEGDAGGAQFTLVDVMTQLQTVWDHRTDPNFALFHYSDLLADLPGQLRRLAGILGIDVTDERIAEYSAAGTFSAMKRRADKLTPHVENGIWHDHRNFFHAGTSGQWRDLLDDAGLRRYRDRVAQLVGPELAAWAHDGVL
ncbi:sulfotransferase domain-containing protein [Amycolatopsis vastitatis]|uniref:sulfotransferase domain-containing protein n=1 Tax=Amycolatopsis vastitatis TaxID=1905142 RepID=UPI0013042C5D|nr:sulfotransferase domain-containing protein [Amycolatopsis vastitatis]